ncbi:MAG: hypothetical protein JO027_15085 [Solirubrobacterales bacterium]|nr:hypothetical protein [Solirubrobacterales bacterium]
MLARLAGRALTGPAAFLVAGLIDVSLMLVLYARWRIAQRRRATGD